MPDPIGSGRPETAVCVQGYPPGREARGVFFEAASAGPAGARSRGAGSVAAIAAGARCSREGEAMLRK